MNGIFLLSLFLSLIKTYDFVWLTLSVEPKTGTEIELVYLEDGTTKQEKGNREHETERGKGNVGCVTENADVAIGWSIPSGPLRGTQTASYSCSSAGEELGISPHSVHPLLIEDCL